MRRATRTNEGKKEKIRQTREKMNRVVDGGKTSKGVCA